MGFPVLISQSLILAIKLADLVSISSAIVAQFAMEQLDFLQDLRAFLLEDVVFSGELVNSLFDLVELVGELADLTGRYSQFLLSLAVLVGQSLVLAVQSADLVSKY